jgi:hypothetical protein
MRKPITNVWFHPSVKEMSYAEFVERYKDQFSEDETTKFAAQLGIKPPVVRKENNKNTEKEPE